MEVFVRSKKIDTVDSWCTLSKNIPDNDEDSVCYSSAVACRFICSFRFYLSARMNCH